MIDPTENAFNSTEYFARVLNHQHRFIHETIAQIKELLRYKFHSESGAQDQIKTVRSLLLYLTHQLEYHFRTEEDHGIFPQILQQLPQHEKKVEAIFKEHPELLEEIGSISNFTELLYKNEEVSFASLVERFKHFEQRLTKHDEKETHLVLDIYNLDIGGN
ncbi:MAG: hemerythrin domain-containing protein [Planctomycetota bacterium]